MFLHLEISLCLFLLTDSWQSCSQELLFQAIFLAHVSWQLHKEQRSPWGSKAWTPSRQVTRVRKTGDDNMDEIPHPKRSVTLCLTILFSKSPCPNHSIFSPGTWDLPLHSCSERGRNCSLCAPSKLKGCPNMREKSGNKCHRWWGISEIDSLWAGGSTAL